MTPLKENCIAKAPDYYVSVEWTIELGGFTSHSLTSSGATKSLAFESSCMKTRRKVQKSLPMPNVGLQPSYAACPFYLAVCSYALIFPLYADVH